MTTTAETRVMQAVIAAGVLIVAVLGLYVWGENTSEKDTVDECITTLVIEGLTYSDAVIVCVTANEDNE